MEGNHVVVRTMATNKKKIPRSFCPTQYDGVPSTGTPPWLITKRLDCKSIQLVGSCIEELERTKPGSVLIGFTCLPTFEIQSIHLLRGFVKYALKCETGDFP
jgi:hypothetical protein